MGFPAQPGSSGQTGSDGPTAGSSAGSQAGGDNNSPGAAAGTQSRLPAGNGAESGARDSGSGELGSGDSGLSSQSGGGLGQPGGDYSLDTLPSGALGGNSRQAGSAGSQPAGQQSGGSSQASAGQAPGAAGGAITASERAAILDERLRRGYEDFDGFILGERERAQRESNAAGSVQAGASGGGSAAANQPQTMPAEGGASTSGVIAASQPVQQSSQPTESFPPPEDIPSGRDDDVVARQIREAAMSEPDPELREALWDEYRRYTGIAEGDE